MDGDRDGFVDEEELVTGIRQMFAPQETVNRQSVADGRVPPETLFARMDADNQQRLYVSDVESFVMPQMRQIVQMTQINKTSFTQTLSEMTGNVALNIMRKADVDKNGFIELMEL